MKLFAVAAFRHPTRLMECSLARGANSKPRAASQKVTREHSPPDRGAASIQRIHATRDRSRAPARLEAAPGSRLHM